MKISSILTGAVCCTVLMLACSFNLEARHHHHHRSTSININLGSSAVYTPQPVVYTQPSYVVEYRPVVYPTVSYVTAPSYVSWGWYYY
jgi:hypothetical protein